MNIKSLLAGSAALAVVSTGAQAADAIVIADPEPVEYVRICDVYGTGFYYIPGTETCLKIGGHMRHQANATTGITKLARFAPIFDARSDTGIGTVIGHATVALEWGFGATRLGFPVGTPSPTPRNTPALSRPGCLASLALDNAYITIVRGSHGWRFGRTATPWAALLGGLFGPADLGIQFARASEIGYTFTGSNG